MTTNPILDTYAEVISTATGLKIETETVEGGYHIRVDEGMSQPLDHCRAWDFLSGVWVGAEGLKRALDKLEVNERRDEAIARAQERLDRETSHYGHGCAKDPARGGGTPGKCPGCGHRLHAAKGCLNMESDDSCDCDDHYGTALDAGAGS